MRLINFFFVAFLLMSGCSNIEFALKNKNGISPLNNKINFEVSGKNYEYVAEALIKHFGSTKTEDDKIYSLNVEIVEEMIKTVIDTNQVSASVQYNIILNYTLINYSGNCKKIQKTNKSKFTHYPKSEGYNFGSDQALQEAYKNNVNENVFSFKNYLSNNEKFIKCINEG